MAIIDKPDFQEQQQSPQDTDLIVPLMEEGGEESIKEENMELGGLVTWVKDRYMRSKDKRYMDEKRWLEAYRNLRGLYGPDVQFSDEEQSKVFVKITKTKVLAAVAQMGDVLFAGNKFPIGIEATPVPEMDMPDKVSVDTNPQTVPPSATITRPELRGMLKEKLEPFKDKVVAGPLPIPTAITYEPAKEAAKKMERKIHDQLEESDADKHLRDMVYEMALFGTGIMKGPFIFEKEYPKWIKDEESGKSLYQPTRKVVPRINSVSIWNFYPDPDARNMFECQGVVERHKFSAHDLRMLKKRDMFRSESIDQAILRGYNYQPHDWEMILEDHASANLIERYEVLEYWGVIDRDTAIEAGIDESTLPDSMKDLDEFQINTWICNDQILRLVINPFTPNRIPYYAVPYEVNPYSFFGIGVAENMADQQEIMNGVMRMTIDNLALSGNIIIEVDETHMVPGQSLKVHPGKIFRRQSGAPGQALFGTKFPNVTQELMQVYDKSRQLVDEATNMPSYAHGGTGIQGMGRTASGMSMLMGAAAQSIKAIVRNIDDYLLAPLGKNLFAFNMQFDYDESIEGDLAVVAKGTESLMRNEIRSQRLLQFMEVGLSNPVTAPLVKADYILRELAASLDLDEDMVVNDQREMMRQAELIRQMQVAMGNASMKMGGGGSVGVGDPTGNGGGNIAPGNAPEPGAAGFTGSGGGNNGGNQKSSSTKADSASA